MVGIRRLSTSDPSSSHRDSRNRWLPSRSRPNNHHRGTPGSSGTNLSSPITRNLVTHPVLSMSQDSSTETSPLLRNRDTHDSDDEVDPHVVRKSDIKPNYAAQAVVLYLLTLIFITALVVLLCFKEHLPDQILPWIGELPREPTRAALAVLDVAPVIDGHIDLPILIRYLYANNVSAVDLNSPVPGHVDIPRLREGKVGGFFWSVYVSCPDIKDAENFTEPSWRVRDTLEQIDVARSLIDKYPDTFQSASTSEDVTTSIMNGKIASLLGVEGGHQLGNSISVLRQYYSLGARYLTLTHTCHNAFADSSGPTAPLHNGLSPLGRRLIDEMNRLGMLVDLSHTSDETAIQVLNYSRAPVIWSHSSARAIHDVQRNLPDDILRLVGSGPDQKEAVVMVNFVPDFVAIPGNASVASVADHVEHIARITGKEHVGLGSDFDVMNDGPTGLEDVSKYPALIAELRKRGWNKFELAGLTGANILRVFQGAERVAKELQDNHTPPVYDLYDRRTDIPRNPSEL